MNGSKDCPEGVSQVDITDSHNVTIALTVTCSVLAAYIGIANLTVILALCRRRVQSPRNGLRASGGSNSPPCHILIVSMSVSDAIIGFFSLPLGAYVIGNNGIWALGKELCSAWIWLDKVLCTVSIYHVALMALDRYIAVCRPLLYRLMSKKTTLTLVFLSWLLPSIISTIMMSGGWHHSDIDWLLNCAELVGICTPIYNRTYLIVISILDFFLPFLVIFVFYFLVTVEICRLDKKLISPGLKSKLPKMKPNSLVKCIQRLCSSKHRARPGEDLELNRGSSSEDNKDEEKPIEAEDSASELILQPIYFRNAKDSIKETELTLKSFDVESNTGSDEQSTQGLVLSCGDHNPQENEIDSIFYDSNVQGLKCDREKIFKTKDTKSITEKKFDPKTRKSFKQTKCIESREDSINDAETTNSDISVFTLSSPNFIRTVNSGAIHDRGALKVFQTRLKYVISADNANRKSRDKPEASPTRKRSNQQNKTSKAFTTIGCVVVCFTVCWLPFSVYNFALVYSGYKMATWPFLLFTWMGYLNSAMNPIFYCFTSSVRQAILALLRPSKQRK
ncbi:5-hydroxytryptamine receptor 4 [Biomphalaria glabrata]|nr:5-hydroxytryptamine receptor 4 [Biomphalaria glabrata]